MKVTLYKPFNKPGVSKVEAAGPTIVGEVKSVDPKKPAITVISQEPAVAEGERSVPVAPDAPVIVNGKKSELAAACGRACVVTLHMSAEPGQRCVVGIVATSDGMKEE